MIDKVFSGLARRLSVVAVLLYILFIFLIMLFVYSLWTLFR